VVKTDLGGFLARFCAVPPVVAVHKYLEIGYGVLQILYLILQVRGRPRAFLGVAGIGLSHLIHLTDRRIQLLDALVLLA